MKKQLLLVLTCWCLTTTIVEAQIPGTLDTSFNGTGILTLAPGTLHDVIYDVAVQQDQKIVYCGVARMVATSGSNSDMFVGRRNQDGTADTSFGNNGFIFKDYGIASDFAYNMVIQPDGKILVVGGASIQSASNTDWVILRLNTDGSYDTTFNNTGIVEIPLGTSEDYAYDVLIQPDNKILVSGSSKVPGFVYSRAVLVRLNVDGTPDVTFGTSGIVIQNPFSTVSNEVFRSIKLLPGGNIIAGGGAYYSNTDHLYLAGFHADGSQNLAFGTNGTYITNLAIDKAYDMVIIDDKLFTGGNSASPTGTSMAIMQFDTSGVKNNLFGTNGFALFTFNSNPINNCLRLALQPDGKIIAAGSSGQGSLGDRDFLAARILQNGTLDPSFGIGGAAIIPLGPSWEDANTIALQADGKVILGGFGVLGSTNDMGIVRLLNDSGAVSTGVSIPVSNENKWVLYPSPSTGSFITLQGVYKEQTSLNIAIYNPAGQLVYQVIENVPASGNQLTQLQLPSDMAAGVYFVRIATAKNLQVLNLVIQ